MVLVVLIFLAILCPLLTLLLGLHLVASKATESPTSPLIPLPGLIMATLGQNVGALIIITVQQIYGETIFFDVISQAAGSSSSASALSPNSAWIVKLCNFSAGWNSFTGLASYCNAFLLGVMLYYASAPHCLFNRALIRYRLMSWALYLIMVALPVLGSIWFWVNPGQWQGQPTFGHCSISLDSYGPLYAMLVHDTIILICGFFGFLAATLTLVKIIQNRQDLAKLYQHVPRAHSHLLIRLMIISLTMGFFGMPYAVYNIYDTLTSLSVIGQRPKPLTYDNSLSASLTLYVIMVLGYLLLVVFGTTERLCDLYTRCFARMTACMLPERKKRRNDHLPSHLESCESTATDTGPTITTWTSASVSKDAI
ncbi:uncharacterized protein BJ171DRAFT_493268 [Polychytrium aggregatum]|uniref:uncharacterized protein n=1 Tax=Polychytrium aggregatum TaxID=110093 RepID=UPI0022FE97DF|nr:uncharacterized protein BJ171DRAFT_493268 [Polychytrium aggregatum]KAI9207626.1 hypothetical protein BJ171DRAFT_493268 [Polychytrium aggregatum]